MYGFMLDRVNKIVRGFRGYLSPRLARKKVDVDAMPKKLRSLSHEELDELTDFGSIMMQELIDHIPQLETKAAIVFGYSGALIAFLLSALRWWPESALLKTGLLFIGACALGVAALAVRGGWNWPSERDGFPEKAFGDLHAMKRRHLDALLYAHQTQGRVADRKAIDILRAQRFLVAATIILGVVFVVAVYLTTFENLVGIPT